MVAEFAPERPRRVVPLDEIGDPNAEPGTRPWALHVRLKMQTALKDERSKAGHLKRLMGLMRKHHGYRELADGEGNAFATFEAFCVCPMPYGLGYDLGAINAILVERRSSEALAAAPKRIRPRGRPSAEEDKNNRYNVTISGRGNRADYWTARIARERPDILARMKSGEFTSVRQAKIAAGWEKPTADIRTDDARLAVRALLKHFSAAAIRDALDRERQEG